MQSSDRISLTRAMDKPSPRKNSDPRQSVGGLLIFGKAVNAVFLLLGGVVLGSLVATGSLDWVYSSSDGSSPLLSCPSRVEIFGSNSALDGSSCTMRFSFSSFASYTLSSVAAFVPNNERGVGSEFMCTQGAAYSACSQDAPCLVKCGSNDSCVSSLGSGTCSQSGFVWGNEYATGAASDCYQFIKLSGTEYQIGGSSMGVSPFCSSSPSLAPTAVVALRGELLGTLLIVLLMVVALIVKAKVAPPTHAVATQKSLLIAKASASELRSTVEARWETEFASSSLSQSAPTHAAKHFASSSWKYRVRVMQAMLKKRVVSARRDHVRSVIVSTLLLVGLSFGATLLLLSVLPNNYPAGSPTLTSVNHVSASIYIPSSFLDALCLADVVIEFVLVFVAAVFLKWQPQLSDRDQRRLANVGATEEACLVLSVSAGTCLRSRGRERLLSSIETGLSEQRFGAVFVLDQGTGTTPLDDTWKFSTGIDPLSVHYVYLPDTQRQLGLYWLAHVWIPFLYKQGRIGKEFKQMVVVDLDVVGRVGIEAGAMNKLLLKKSLEGATTEIATNILIPAHSANQDVADWESMRLRAQFYHRMMEVGLTGGAVLAVSGPVTVWDRLGLNIAPSDSTQVALTALKRRGRVHFAVSSETPTVPDTRSIYTLYCTQARTLRTAASLFRELALSISSFVHGPSVGLKIFILLGPLASLLVLLIRHFLIATLLFRDPLSLLVLLVTFYLLALATSGLHLFTQWRGDRTKDLPRRCIFSYPVYQLYLGCMELGLAVSGGTFGRMADEETDRPYLAHLSELYPCPPHPEIDWFTIWRTSDSTRLSVLSAAIDATKDSAVMV